MSHEENIKSENLETPKTIFRQMRNLKVENARLKYQLMVQQAMMAVECGKKPNWGIKNDS